MCKDGLFHQFVWLDLCSCNANEGLNDFKKCFEMKISVSPAQKGGTNYNNNKINNNKNVCVVHNKLTEFPVPGFQWYPNTSSKLTVLHLSTSFSSSSCEPKEYKLKLTQETKKKQVFLKMKRKLYTFNRGGKWTCPR